MTSGEKWWQVVIGWRKCEKWWQVWLRKWRLGDGEGWGLAGVTTVPRSSTSLHTVQDLHCTCTASLNYDNSTKLLHDNCGKEQYKLAPHCASLNYLTKVQNYCSVTTIRASVQKCNIPGRKEYYICASLVQKFRTLGWFEAAVRGVFARARGSS